MAKNLESIILLSLVNCRQRFSTPLWWKSLFHEMKEWGVLTHYVIYVFSICSRLMHLQYWNAVLSRCLAFLFLWSTQYVVYLYFGNLYTCKGGLYIDTGPCLPRLLQLGHGQVVCNDHSVNQMSPRKVAAILKATLSNSFSSVELVVFDSMFTTIFNTSHHRTINKSFPEQIMVYPGKQQRNHENPVLRGFLCWESTMHLQAYGMLQRKPAELRYNLDTTSTLPEVGILHVSKQLRSYFSCKAIC